MSQMSNPTIASADLQAVLAEFKTTQTGLSQEEAATRLDQNGPNTIRRGQQTPEWRVFLKNFVSMMALLLWVSGLIAMLTGSLELGIAIWAVNIINGLFSYWQEHQAAKATNSLMAMLPTYTRVYRDGKLQQVDANDLVVGDVYELQAGNAVPADGRLLQATSMQVDQSALTGESVPEDKTVAYTPSDGDYEESNLVYAGTTMSAGTGTVVVTQTGMATEFGKIAALTQQQTKVASPLQQELTRLTRQLSLLAVGIGIAFFVLAIWFVHYPIAKSFIFALGMIVAFIPEGLLPTVTLSLAQGVSRMAKKHALVKELESVETLGETTVICSDKTGTLTQNQMTIKNVWLPSGEYTVTGEGYVNNGHLERDGKTVDYQNDADLKQLITISALDNDTHLAEGKDAAHPKIMGTPTEAALVILAQKAGFNLAGTLQSMPRVNEFPFDSNRKAMTTVHQSSQGLFVAVKGSLGDLLDKCDQIQENGQTRALTDADKKRILAANARYAKTGLRSLAMMYKTVDGAASDLTIDTAESHLTFVGLTIMEDPPRPEIYEAVEKCHRAAIKIIMVTGDSPATAKAIAVEIGINTEAVRVVTGTELDAMTDDQLRAALKTEVLFARVAPEHKYRIVENCQAMGEVVASTGDGVNDAPALKKANIGVAMGVTGTDVAKDAADMILTDDNFASIVAAVEEGRAVYSNIQKFLLYILNSNVPEAVPSALFLLSRGLIPLPLTIMQILTIDLGTDLLPALGLGAEKPEPGVMDQPPRKRNAHLLNKRVLWTAVGWYGLLASAISTFAYFFVNVRAGWPDQALMGSGVGYARATTMTLAAIVFCQIATAINCRTSVTSIFKIGLFSNRRIWLGIVVEIALIALLSYTPGLQGAFNMAPLQPTDWLFLVAIPIPLFLIEEARKWGIRRHRSRMAG